MEFQQSHLRYMRPPQAPPPSSMSDPNHHQPPVPPPPGPTWFSGQFQYHGHSPSPPPNHNQPQWAPPPPPPPAPYSAPPPYPAPPPYAGHHQYPPPPRPPVPPPHPPHSQIPQSYPHQDWQNPSWGQHQGWEYPAHNNGEDWAAKARAWAAAKTSTDDQYPQSQFTSVGRMEENQYPIVNPHHSDVQHLSLPASSYQQYPPSVAPPYRAPESASFNSGYVPDGHLPFTARNGTLIGDSNAAFHHQESSPSSLSVHQQEVPSSYSSIAGKEEASDQNEKLYKSPWAFTSTPQHHAPPPPAAVGRSVSMEQSHYAFGQQAAEPTSDRSDQPLDFTPRFSRDHDPHVQPNYTSDSGVPVRGTDHVTAVPSINSWNSPAAPAAIYPSMHTSGPQVDPSLAIPSSIPGHSGPLFGRMPGQNFQPIIPSVSAPFGASTGTFPGDAYGASGVSDRPKKASVPNWLKEEIIKKKAVIATSAPELSEEEIKSIEEEAIDKSLRKGDKGDPADSKSIDSSRSTEEEDDEEDDVEAARTIAINQEIKRVLTEVLLKVTDELFDEIATQVLSEDDSSFVVDHNTAASNYEVSPSTPAVPTLKTSAMVLISAKTKETVIDDVSGKSTLSAPRDVLGLANYASDDDDEDDDIQKFGAPNCRRSSVHQPLTTKKLPDDLSVVWNGSSLAETKENHKNNLNGESRPGRMSPNATSGNHSALVSELNNNLSGRESMHSTLQSRYSSKTEFLADETKNNGENVVDGNDVFMPKDNVEEKVVMKTDPPVQNVYAKKSSSDDNEDRETRNKPDKNDSKRSNVGKEFFKEAEGDRTHMRADESHRRQDERKVKKEKTDDRNGSKERIKEQSLKSGEKSKDADSKKRSSHTDDKEGRKETEKDRRTSGKEDNGRKRDRTKDEKGERSRHKLSSDSSKHKRHRSSSVGSRGRNKNQAVVSHTNDSSDESSDDSRRKLRSRKRNLSPSPVRSRRRQVSRSPHSKHSQRRHSPYSSLETTREKRSRSRSPARRKR